MKIGLIRRGYSKSGGAEAYLKRFGAAAVAAGHAATLFTSREWPSAEWPHGEIKRVKHGGTPLEFALALSASPALQECEVLFSLERVLKCDCYRAGDGVHAVWLRRKQESLPAWRRFFARQRTKDYELLQLEETLFRGEGAEQVIANSRMVRDEIVEGFGYPADRIHVVYNGVPAALDEEASARARHEVRQELGLGPRDFVALFAGSGWSRKGLRHAIGAMDEAAISRPLLLVAGKGRPGQMPRSSRVRYLGTTAGIARHLAAADVFILPTIYDPFSNACLEAVAAGLPIITTRFNGCAEIIAPGEEGDIVDDPRDTLRLAKALEAWAPPERRAEVRPKLRALGAQFTIERNLQETLAVLAQAARPSEVAPAMPHESVMA